MKIKENMMSYCEYPFTRFLCVLLALGLLVVSPPHRSTAAPQETPSTIAYVDGLSWDQIRLIEADGSNNRLLWTHGLADPYDAYGYNPGLYNVVSLSWRPDGSELAFSSSHERECSLNTSDIFVMQANGSGLRRVTQAPGCAALASYPKGTVTIPVENPYGSQFELAIYFQGALSVQQISIPPNGRGVVVFEDVADLGVGVLQRAILINETTSDDRDYGEDTAVDVQAGTTVQTAELFLEYPNIGQRKMRSPTWHRNASRLGYLFNYTSPYVIDTNPGLLAQGEYLLTAGYLPGRLPSADHLRWGPTPERANQFLYVGKDESTNKGIYLVEAGSDTMGERLVSVHWLEEEVLDLAWLPDGSGFLYALKEPLRSGALAVKSNLYAYDFETEIKTRLTNLEEAEFVGRFSLSPDGEQIVFERSSGWGPHYATGELVDPDLWIMDRDGGNMRLLVEDARAPAWHPQKAESPTPVPSPTRQGLYLPLLHR